VDLLSAIKQVFDFTLPFFEAIPALRVILAFLLVFMLPGFAWTLIFFKKLNAIERVTLSLGLSIVLVTLSILVLNVLLDIRITGMNSTMIILIITVIPLVIYFLKRLSQKKDNA